MKHRINENEVLETLIAGTMNRYRFANINQPLLDGIAGDIKRAIINSPLRGQYDVRVWADPLAVRANQIKVSVTPRSAVDRLSDIGHRERAKAAYERGLQDGERLKNGVSADEIVLELEDDPV